MRILGIETSCDETAAAVVTRDSDGIPKILSNVVLSQIAEHAEYGGVVPEIAARAHLTNLDRIISTAMDEAGVSISDLDGIGATAGPGLIGGLMVGLMTAKAIAASRNIPFLSINHLEGHALTARLTHNLEFPYLLLLVSGGHTQILKVRGLGDYERWATTIDDAAGETFDKSAKLLGLGFPGGPNIENMAIGGNSERFSFPEPMKGRETLNMSFSGLKTAIRQEAEKLVPLDKQDVADLCIAIQDTISNILIDRCRRSMDRFSDQETLCARTLVAAGGVAANATIRAQLESLCEELGWRLVLPPLKLCTDNAAMIAWAALERFERGESSQLDASPRSRWPLDETADATVGSGRRGVKV